MSDREEKSRKIINHVKLFIFSRNLWLHSFSTLYFSPVYHLKGWISSVITICNFGKDKILFTNVGAGELRIQDQSCLRWRRSCRRKDERRRSRIFCTIDFQFIENSIGRWNFFPKFKRLGNATTSRSCYSGRFHPISASWSSSIIFKPSGFSWWKFVNEHDKPADRKLPFQLIASHCKWNYWCITSAETCRLAVQRLY